MTRQKYLLESIAGVLLVGYAAVTVWSLSGLNSKLDKSLFNMNKRFSLIRNYAPRGPITSRRLSNIDEAGALRVMEELARSSGVRLEYIKLKNEETPKRAGYKAMPFDLNLGGPEQGLFDFITNIKKLGFLCRISGLRIKADGKEDDTLHAQIRLEKIDLPDKLLQQGIPDTFLPMIMNRKIFKAVAPVVPKNVNISGGRLNVIQDLVLVGLIDDNGKKAILEDKKTQKTLFLKKDDTIEGLSLIEIRDSEVVLSDGKEQFNLTL